MNRALNLFLATRPAFLSITLLGCFMGITIPGTHKESFTINTLAIALALLIHAAGNLLNDYFDHLNGSDQNNNGRITPFTGGSRYIQNKILKPSHIYRFGLILISASISIGLYICSQTTWLLIPIGLAGIALAWSYSAPPLELMAKGALGEIAIAIAWSLIVIGFATLQTENLASKSIPIGITYGLLMANILLVNQIPDIEADRKAGKLTLASQISRHQIWIWYSTICIAAYTFQVIGIYFFETPSATIVTVILLPIFLLCAKNISKYTGDKYQTRKLIVRNMVAAHLYCLLLCLGLLKGT